jgi:hypothetical protein
MTSKDENHATSLVKKNVNTGNAGCKKKSFENLPHGFLVIFVGSPNHNGFLLFGAIPVLDLHPPSR